MGIPERALTRTSIKLTWRERRNAVAVGIVRLVIVIQSLSILLIGCNEKFRVYLMFWEDLIPVAGTCSRKAWMRAWRKDEKRREESLISLQVVLCSRASGFGFCSCYTLFSDSPKCLFLGGSSRFQLLLSRPTHGKPENRILVSPMATRMAERKSPNCSSDTGSRHSGGLARLRRLCSN